jgi:hypothetical protein
VTWRRLGQRRSRFRGGALRTRLKRRQAAALQGGVQIQTVTLDTPSRANFLAVCLYELLQRSKRPLPAGTAMIISDGMKARIVNDGTPVIMSGDGPADYTIQADLGVLLKILAHKGRLLPAATVHVRLRGNPLKAWALLRAIRC